jgi:hypothetical protein
LSSRLPNTLGPFIAYHGCDLDTAESVLAGKNGLKLSQNDYDWLGPGVYFWVDSQERGLQWAIEQSKLKKSHIKTPAVIGAYILPGLCLNLTDYGVNESLKIAYDVLKVNSASTGTPLPQNKTQKNGIFMQRQLDCAAIKILHTLREIAKEPPYDTVYGVFEEGNELFPGSGFKQKTHVQIAVRNPDNIIGYFRVKS